MIDRSSFSLVPEVLHFALVMASDEPGNFRPGCPGHDPSLSLEHRPSRYACWYQPLAKNLR